MIQEASLPVKFLLKNSFTATDYKSQKKIIKRVEFSNIMGIFFKKYCMVSRKILIRQ